MFSQRNKYKRYVLPLSLFVLTAFLVLVTSYLYLKKTASFRFFDEENNIVAGYLITTGRRLYSDIFMNHNPLPLYMSAAIQKIVPVQTLFELVKVHRLFMILFGIGANILLYVRFRSKALMFICVYEFMRYYVSGQMFLAEGMIAYMFAYIVLLIISTLTSHKKIQKWDIVITSFCFTFIILSREPYIPVALFLYSIVFLLASSKKQFILSALLALGITAAVMIQFDLSEFYKQVFLLNREMARNEFKVQDGMQMFSGLTQLYQYVQVGLRFDKPLYILLALVNILLLFLSVNVLKRTSRMNQIVILTTGFVVLFLAGVRNFGAGVEWFGMYRSIPYISILLAMVSALASNRISLLVIIVTFLIAFLHPRSHVIEKRVNAEEYYINYSQTNQVGAVITALCKDYPKPCTLHIDDIYVYPYWITKKPPSYKYAFYYGVNQIYLDYKAIRERELLKSAPTIYYDANCMVSPVGLPAQIKSDYTYLTEINLMTHKEKQSCIAVQNELLPYVDADVAKEIFKNQLFFKKQL